MIDSTPVAPLQIACLVSGPSRGSNLKALIDACSSGEIPAQVALVIGTRADAPALEIARAAGAHTSVISPRKYASDEAAYAETILSRLRRHDIGLICLTGFLRQLPVAIVAAFTNRIMNVHPALLPLFGGRGMYGENVHQAVLDSGMKVSGCTVHFVDEQYDAGPIIAQVAVPVQDNDTPASLSARILPEEHDVYVRAVKLFAEGRLCVKNRRVMVWPP